jgi:hypothetical protein
MVNDSDNKGSREQNSCNIKDKECVSLRIDESDICHGKYSTQTAVIKSNQSQCLLTVVPMI